MTQGIQDHIHLQLEDDAAEAGEYHVSHGTLDQTPWVPLSVERGVTGKLFTYRLLGETGKPLSFNADAMILFLTRAEKDAVVDLFGQDVCYIPIYHTDSGDTAGHLTDRIHVVISPKSGGVQPVDPACTYWRVGIEINDNETV